MHRARAQVVKGQNRVEQKEGEALRPERALRRVRTRVGGEGCGPVWTPTSSALPKGAREADASNSARRDRGLFLPEEVEPPK